MSKRKQNWSPQKALGKKLLKYGGKLATATGQCGHPIAGATASMMNNAIERCERKDEMDLDAADNAGTDSAGSNMRRKNPCCN